MSHWLVMVKIGCICPSENYCWVKQKQNKKVSTLAKVRLLFSHDLAVNW